MLERLFGKLRDAFSDDTADENETDRAESLRLATAALLVEVARADHDFGESELETLLALIREHFSLDAQSAAMLSDSADERVSQSVSLHEFTRVLHEHLEPVDKAAVIAMMWKIAYADGQLDKYEDALVLKVSDLLYVPRVEVMRLKHEAQPD